jgi:hypothetical protein
MTSHVESLNMGPVESGSSRVDSNYRRDLFADIFDGFKIGSAGGSSFRQSDNTASGSRGDNSTQWLPNIQIDDKEFSKHSDSGSVGRGAGAGDCVPQLGHRIDLLAKQLTNGPLKEGSKVGQALEKLFSKFSEHGEQPMEKLLEKFNERLKPFGRRLTLTPSDDGRMPHSSYTITLSDRKNNCQLGSIEVDGLGRK